MKMIVVFMDNAVLKGTTPQEEPTEELAPSEEPTDEQASAEEPADEQSP